MIMRKEQHEGEFTPGYSVSVGYYAQNQSDELDGNKTVFETIDDEAVGDIRKSVRSMLGAFLFSGDDVDKKVKVLSGGEKARLALCKLLLQPYNFLVLDEPTNHLDLASKEVLKQALMRYDGTLFVVSHDRDFLHGLTNTVYEIKPDRMRIWPGDVLDFLKEKKAESIAMFEKSKQTVVVKAAPQEVEQNPVSRDELREREKQKKKFETQLQKCEREIERLEAELAKMNSEIAELDYTDADTSKKKLEAYATLKSELDATMKQWEETGTLLSGF
jgi:ATP-binding cassette subfamily F protein 3